MDRKEFRESIPALEQVWVLYSVYTRVPYVECVDGVDQVYIYTTEESAKVGADSRNTDFMHVKALGVPNKQLLKAFSAMFDLGIDQLVFNNSEEEFSFPLPELVTRPDFSKLPLEQRPISNPTLQISMLYYAQEARKPSKFRDQTKVKELEEEMVMNVMRANYLVPTRVVELHGESVQQMVLLETSEGAKVVPVFTDIVEYRKLAQKGTTIPGVTNFDRMAQTPLTSDCVGFIINPFGVHMPLPKDFIAKILEVIKKDK